MMDFVCPLAFRYKKGEYIVEFLFSGGEYFCWLELMEFRLYLGASHYILSFGIITVNPPEVRPENTMPTRGSKLITLPT